MADRTAVVEKVREIAERVGASEGVEVVDVQLLGGGNSRVLRIFIDKPEGVTHADCEFMSLNAGTILDVEDVIPGGHYTLEVSSPGVERKLTQARWISSDSRAARSSWSCARPSTARSTGPGR